MPIEIIAEIGQNHNGDMSVARDLIIEAAAAGATVAKFQAYDAKKLFPKLNNKWYDYNCATELSKSDLRLLSSVCIDNNIEFMASPFDIRRVDWLESMNVNRYKIASRSIFDNDLIKAVEETKKPCLASLGYWIGKYPSLDELPNIKNSQYMYCISSYPTLSSEFNFNMVDFSLIQGFSDHSIGLFASFIAISQGASFIEKHYTLDKNSYGPDHSCSMSKQELKDLVAFCNFYSQSK